MAETRSIARALRFACNIDLTALEELDGQDNVISKTSTKEPVKEVPKEKSAGFKRFSAKDTPTVSVTTAGDDL